MKKKTVHLRHTRRVEFFRLQFDSFCLWITTTMKKTGFFQRKTNRNRHFENECNCTQLLSEQTGFYIEVLWHFCNSWTCIWNKFSTQIWKYECRSKCKCKYTLSIIQIHTEFDEMVLKKYSVLGRTYCFYCFRAMKIAKFNLNSKLDFNFGRKNLSFQKTKRRWKIIYRWIFKSLRHFKNIQERRNIRNIKRNSRHDIPNWRCQIFPWSKKWTLCWNEKIQEITVGKKRCIVLSSALFMFKVVDVYWILFFQSVFLFSWQLIGM